MKFENCEYSDGTDQWYADPHRYSDTNLMIERELHPAKGHEHRLKWHIVDRGRGETEANGWAFDAEGSYYYPPIVCGPFDDLELAKTTLLLLI